MKKIIIFALVLTVLGSGLVLFGYNKGTSFCSQPQTPRVLQAETGRTLYNIPILGNLYSMGLGLGLNGSCNEGKLEGIRMLGMENIID